MVDTNLLIDDLVSVIIPVYNSEKFIKDTIQSVLDQTYQKFEILIIDDCSLDHSMKIVNEFKDERIHVIRLKQNSGVAVARNTGIEQARGRYIAFLDSDDLWSKEKLIKQIEFIHQYNHAFVYTAIDMVDELNNQVKKHISIPCECDYKLLQKNTLIATSSVLIDRQLVKDFIMPNMRSGQDYATWMKILANGIVAYGINEPLVHYRERNNSLSSNKLKSIKQVWLIQTKQEKISRCKSFVNIIFFCINALKKHI